MRACMRAGARAREREEWRAREKRERARERARERERASERAREKTSECVREREVACCAARVRTCSRHRGNHTPHVHTAHTHRSPLIVVQGDAISVLRERVMAASVSHIVLSYPGIYTTLYYLSLSTYSSIEDLSIYLHTYSSICIHTVVLNANAHPSSSSPSS